MVFIPTRMWRGKTKYQEVDGTPHYELHEEGEETPRRKKIPKTCSGSEGVFQDFQEARAMGEDESASVPRRTKVR